MPVAFDTHQFITRLIHGQMPLEQAEAVSAALQEALEASIGQLATKDDVTHLGNRLTFLQWAVGLGFSFVMALLLVNLNWTWQIMQRLPR